MKVSLSIQKTYVNALFQNEDVYGHIREGLKEKGYEDRGSEKIRTQYCKLKTKFE